MSKLRYKEGGVWKSIAPSQKEFDDNKNEVAVQLADTITLVTKYSNLVTGGDWSSALQATVDFVNNKGGGVIKFPYGTYIIGGVNLTGYSNIKFECDSGTVLKFKDNVIGFLIDNTNRITFDDYFVFDCSLHTTSSSYAIKGTLVSRFSFKKVEVKEGSWGVFINQLTNGIISECEGHNFTYWAFYVEGAENFKYLNNTCYDNAYDGLKLAGVDVPSSPLLLKNIEVAFNVCYRNARDGFDIAGNNIDGLEVHDNIFRDNTLNGIDFKNVYQGSYCKDVSIYNNKCLNNAENQINVQFGVVGFAINRIFVHNNKVVGNDLITGASIRAVGLTEDCRIYDNDAFLNLYGVRLIDSNKARVYENNLYNIAKPVYVELQGAVAGNDNIIENNDIYSPTGSCVYIIGAGLNNTVVRWNVYKTDAATNRIQDTGTGTKIYENFAGSVIAPPSGRAMKGDIYALDGSAITAGKYSQYVATTTSSSATFKGRNTVDLTTTVSYDPPSLIDGGGVTTTVAIVGASLGDYAIASFGVDLQGITVTAWVSATDIVSVRFQNETGGTIDLINQNLRVRVLKN